MKSQVLLWLSLLVTSLLFISPLQAQTDFPGCSDYINLAADSARFMQYGRAGQFDSAIAMARKMETICLKQYGEWSHSYAMILSYYLGYTYSMKGDIPNAYACHKRAIAVFEKLNDVNTLKYGDAAFRFAVFSYDYSAWTDAEKYFKIALLFYVPEAPIWKFFATQARYTYAQIQLLLAATYCNEGEYEKAISLNMSVNDIVDTMRNDLFMNYLRASMYNNMGVLYSQTGNPLKCLAYMKKSLPTEAMARQQGYSGSDYLEVLLNLADAYVNCNLTDSALMKCHEAEDSLRLEKNKYPLIYAKLLKEKANIYQHLNRLPEAISLYEQYCRIVDTLPEKPADHESNLINLGIAYSNAQRYVSADAFFRGEINRLRTSGLAYSYEMLQASSGLCENLIAQNKYEEASDSLVNLIHLTLATMKRNFAGMSENDQLQYKTWLSGIFDLLYTCLYNHRSIRPSILSATASLELQRNNLVLSNHAQFLQKARESEDTAFTLLYRSWLSCRELLSGQYARPYDQRQFSVDSLEEVSETLEQKLAASGYGSDITPITETLSHSIQLPAGAADVAFIRFHYKGGSSEAGSVRYAAFIYISGDSLPVFVRLCNEAALEHLLKRGRRAQDEDQITQKIYNRNGPDAPLLYRLIWQPLEPYLHGISSVHYSTSGLLNNISFQALYTGKGYLAERYSLHRHLNLREAVTNGAMDSIPRSINLWGNIDYNNIAATAASDTTRQLTGAITPQYLNATATTKGAFNGPLPNLPAAEIDGLKKAFTAHHLGYTDYEKGEATEENFKLQAPHMKGVLHISTHGFYVPYEKEREKNKAPGSFMAGIINPLFRCGLAFSGVNYYWLNGRARDHHEDGMLTGFEIAQLDLHQVDLVILSACETGLGDVTDDEGNLGLQRAFRLAGVKRLLVSLWQVPARQTGELLSLFYTEWLQGKPIDQALYNAQHTLQKRGYPPYYWAGFVLIE